MSLEFYDATGRAYAYSNDGVTLYTYAGTPIAYFYSDSVYSYQGEHLGFFQDWCIWDNEGGCLLFAPAASRSSPPKPTLKPIPRKAAKKHPPLKWAKRSEPVKHPPKHNWSWHPASAIFGT